ncbi:hypothetical protein [Bryobacter aggregatus]|uniref:hypothetical protein n=1 Tax=Bryobacter aggregatus TaxID=360054 RepID=UPI0004E16B7B|nr:hypothetical protein [Bryobacter aggregatus]
MRFVVLLLGMGMLVVGAPVKKTAEPPKRPKDNNCVDTPRIAARKMKKLDASQLLGKELDGVRLGLSVNSALDLNLEMESPNEQNADQLEKMVGLLVRAEKLKTSASDRISIDLPAATRVKKSGKTVMATISLTDAQLEKLLEARYGRKLVSEVRSRFIYVYGLREGTRSIPFDVPGSVAK